MNLNSNCKSAWWDGQYEFMVTHGLLPFHRLLDLGCGPLGGGMRLIEYLDPSKYFGIDASMYLNWNLHVLQRANDLFVMKHPIVIQSALFEVEKFGARFDYAMAFSLLTHLNLNEIIMMLVKVRPFLDGSLYATIFELGEDEDLLCVKARALGPTQLWKDSYHYRVSQVQWAARQAGMEAFLLGRWISEAAVQQQMVEFRVVR